MATIRTHTTLRTLFAATAVFAVLAATWTAAPRGDFHLLVTPCAICFVAALFGLSLSAGFIIGFATMIAVCACFIGLAARVNQAALDIAEIFDWVIDIGLKNAVILACWSATPWMTSWWWGSYLRYVWSKPRGLVEPDAAEEDLQTDAKQLSLHERLLIRCELTPVGIFILTLLANVLIVMMIASAMPIVEVRY